MATMSRVSETQHRADACGAPPQPGEPGSGSPHPSPSFLVLRSRPELKSLGSYSCLNQGRVVPPPPSGFWVSSPAPPSDSRVPLPAPPPAAPARGTTPQTKNWRAPQVNPSVRLAQSKRFAEGALEHYDRRKKIKFELVDVKPCGSLPEPGCFYTHINFTARSSKEDSQEQLFFAELCHCSRRRENFTPRSSNEGLQGQVSFTGRKPIPRGFSVTCCEPLDSDCTAGRRFLERDGSLVVRKHADFNYCYGCTERMYHPKGDRYVAGHCTVPYIYDWAR